MRLSSSLNKKATLLFISNLLILLISSKVIGQTQALKEFNISDGLPSSHIYQTIQDRNGFIWVATDKGVSKYDGYSFENFTVKDGLPSNDVWGLHEDSKGRIWLNTFNQFVYIKNDIVHTFSPDSSQLNGTSINHLFNNEIHLATIYSPIKNIYHVNEKLEISTPLDESILAQVLNHVFLFDLNKFIDLDTKIKGNNLITAGHWQFLDENQILKEFLTRKTTKAIKSVLINKAQIIFNFQDSLVRFKNGNLENLQVDKNVVEHFKAVTIENSNQYLLPSKDYIYWLDENFQIIPNFLLESNLIINTARLDRENNLWISTKDGLFLLRRKAFSSKSYTSIKNKPLELFSIQKDESNRIWMGGNNGTLYLFDKDGDHNEFLLSKNNNRPIQGIDVDGEKGMLLSGFYNYYIPGNFNNPNQQPLTPTNYSSLTINLSHSDREFIIQNTKCILVKNKSFLISHSNTLTEMVAKGGTIKRLNSKSINRTYALATNYKNEICFGQTNGLIIRHPDNMQSANYKQVRFNVPIIDLEYDDDDYLWIATQGQGLFRYKENQMDTIQDLYDQYVNNIMVDENKDVWVCSSTGIHQLKIDPNHKFKYSHKKYDRSYGLISSEVNDFIISDNHIYAATKRGLSILEIDPDIEPIDSSFLLISNVSINEKDTLLLEDYELEHDENNIRIEFVWLSFLNDQKVTYSYNLVGEDAEWKSTQNLFKEYSNLSPGTYKFKIRVNDHSGIQLSSEKNLTFTIHKPWWLSSLSIAFFSLLIFLLLYAIYVMLIRRAKRISEKKNQLNKQFAELELNALQAQMNPHFIFNALNSIQDFIFSKDNRTANKYLVKFSKLMRLFLESSKEKNIQFSEELKLLQLYVELEELRFGDKFSSEFTVDDSIDQESTKIPSMIIQPFVENAINHGLKYKETGGKLKIKFQKKDQAIICKIEDNGIGREMSKKLKQKNKSSYKSRGMHLVNERKNIFNLMQQTNIEIIYSDMKDKANNALGTSVEILLPI